MTTILAAMLDEATIQTIDASLHVDTPTFCGAQRCRPGFEVTLLEDISIPGSPRSVNSMMTTDTRCDDDTVDTRSEEATPWQLVTTDTLLEEASPSQVLDATEAAPSQVPDATVLFDTEAVRAEPMENGPRSQKPVLSFVSTNPRTAVSFDVLCGATVVVQEVPYGYPVRTLNVSCGRDPANTIVLRDRRISQTHFTVQVRASADGSVALEVRDQSSNGTFVNGKRVGKGHRTRIMVGDRVVALPAEEVGRDEEIGFQVLHDTKGAACASLAIAHLAIDEDGDAKISEWKVGVPKELENDLQCGVCTDIFHRCLTLVPCGHNFCASCFLSWRQQSSACPGCRAYVRQVVRNQDMDRMVETFVQGHPDLERAPAELQEMLAVEQKPENDAMLRWLIKGPRNPMKHPDGDRLNIATPQRQRRQQSRRAGSSSSSVCVVS